MTNSMPRGCIRAEAETAAQAVILSRRASMQTCVPEPERPVVSLTDRELLQAVLDGLHRLGTGVAR